MDAGSPGDLPQRVCTAAEMKFYFESFLEGNGRKNYVKPNKNCNLTSWIDGCEPGWSCSAGKDLEVNLKDAVNIPSRTLDCRGCCAGFFCPHGLTCMIRKQALVTKLYLTCMETFWCMSPSLLTNVRSLSFGSILSWVHFKQNNWSLWSVRFFPLYGRFCHIVNADGNLVQVPLSTTSRKAKSYMWRCW